ncbi:MAG: DsbA family protein [Candidatus Latescibacterota bacterium]|nr:DsbA family protein [Candidatus Latescibacterota bacterium]
MPTLYYVADPMCSWCWGFTPTIEALRAEDRCSLHYVMGGLACDSDEPMPTDMRDYVQDAWREVAQRTGASFNWDFWSQCQPRRSTYSACRAVLAAGDLGPHMFHRIQRAYYLEARNPSDVTVLVELAADLGMDSARFVAALASCEIEAALQDQFRLRRRLQATAFPSLLLELRGIYRWINRGWENGEVVLTRFEELIAEK